MNPITSFVKRHPLIVFFGLAYALSWAPSLIEPHSLLPLGPLFAALLVLTLTEGLAGVRAFLGRIVQWRVGLHWYVLVLGLPLLLNALAVGLNLLLGAQPTPDRIPPLADLLPTFLMVLFFIGLGEEPAWRGYALPRLSTGRSLLLGSLLLGVLHALWHLPLFGLEYTLQNGLAWFIGLMGYTLVASFVYQHTEGNLLLPALFHASVNTTAVYLFGSLFSGADTLQLWWLWGALWCGAAGLILLGSKLYGSRQGVASEVGTGAAAKPVG